MRTVTFGIAILSGLLGNAGSAVAADPPADSGNAAAAQAKPPAAAASDSKATAVPNDLTNYQGDRVSFNGDVIVTIQKADGSAGGQVCIPARVKLRGGVGYSASGTDGKTETGTLFRLQRNRDETPNVLKRMVETISGRNPGKQCAPESIPKDAKLEDYGTLQPSVDLRVAKDTLERTQPNRYGLTYGLLAIPFKYQLTGPKDFSGSATVGPYFGYRTLDTGNGYGVSYIGFLGYSNLSVTQTVGGQSTTQNLASIGYGIGAIATVKGNFQMGAVLGFDHVSKSANYQYNNKPWLAVELGYSFLQ